MNNEIIFGIHWWIIQVDFVSWLDIGLFFSIAMFYILQMFFAFMTPIILLINAFMIKENKVSAIIIFLLSIPSLILLLCPILGTLILVCFYLEVSNYFDEEKYEWIYTTIFWYLIIVTFILTYSLFFKIIFEIFG